MSLRPQGRARFRKGNGDIPQFLANGVRPHLSSRRVRSHRRGLTPFAREAGNWGMSPFPFLAAARRKRTAFTSAKMAALRCNTAAVERFLLAALHSVAKRVSRGQAYHPTQSRPRWPEDQLRTPPPPRSAAPFPPAAIAACRPGVEWIAR